MTDKCWFVLRHTHHAPPTLTTNPSTGQIQSTGPICIGHVIPSTKQLDIINFSTGPEPYPVSMPIHSRPSYDLSWTITSSGNADLSANVSAPIAAAAGVDLTLNARLAFKRSVSRYWEFESLETTTVNMTQSYLDDTLDLEAVKRHIASHKKLLMINPSLFIITGIMVGRKGRISQADGTERGVNADVVLGVEEVVSVGGGFDVGRSRGTEHSQSVDDMVFAIRVAKVTKGVFDKDWCWGTFSGGATFGEGDDEKERRRSIREELVKCGYRVEETIGLDEGEGEVFVLEGDVGR